MKDDKFLKEVNISSHNMRIMAVTIIVMTAVTSSLQEEEVRSKMIEAQTILRTHKILPNELTDEVRGFYAGGLAMV